MLLSVHNFSKVCPLHFFIDSLWEVQHLAQMSQSTTGLFHIAFDEREPAVPSHAFVGMRQKIWNECCIPIVDHQYLTEWGEIQNVHIALLKIENLHVLLANPLTQVSVFL